MSKGIAHENNEYHRHHHFFCAFNAADDRNILSLIRLKTRCVTANIPIIFMDNHTGFGASGAKPCKV